MENSIDIEEKLIYAVRKNEFLWNSQNKFHKNSKMRIAKWNELSAEFGIPDPYILWKKLRDKYVKRKLLMDSPCGPETKLLPPWHLFDTLDSFLRKQVTHRKSSRNLYCSLPPNSKIESTEDTCDDIVIEKCDAPETPTFDQQPDSPSPSIHTPSRKRGLQINDTSCELEKSLLAVLAQQPEAKKKSAEEHFGSFVAETLARLPLQVRVKTQLSIHKLLIEAELPTRLNLYNKH